VYRVIPIFVLVGLLVIMVLLLVAPAAVNDVMRWSTPPESRPGPEPRPYFAVIMIFAIGILLFHETGLHWHSNRLAHLDPLQLSLNGFGAVFLGTLGIIACFWPQAFMRAFVPALRRVPEAAIEARSKNVIEKVSKIVGAMLLLACSYIVHLIAVAK
jgi:hypothetical protein